MAGVWYINMTKLSIIMIVISRHHNKSLYMNMDRQTRHKLYTVARPTETGGESGRGLSLRFLSFHPSLVLLGMLMRVCLLGLRRLSLGISRPSLELLSRRGTWVWS